MKTFSLSIDMCRYGHGHGPSAGLSLLRRLVPFLFGVLACWLPMAGSAAALGPGAEPEESAYVIGDSIAYGLHLDGLEAKLQAQLGGPARISFDGARSITTPGNQIKKSALDSVNDDRAFIAKASIIIIVLGMSQQEVSFEASQKQLLQLLKTIAPQAQYYWVDIGGTIAPQVPGWIERNKILYSNASQLGYQVISRYKAIFGANADPMAIKPGQNFPGWTTEEGYGGAGNIHGFNAELSKVILDTLAAAKSCRQKRVLSTYLLGDSIAFGLYQSRFATNLQTQLGGAVKISYDVGRSITKPGLQIKKTALQSIELDRDFIAQADVIIVALGTNQTEASFVDSQRLLLQRLRALAPQAQYYWIDIGATIATQAASWSERNRIIYENAASLDYRVISRYKAIFGPGVDPLKIVPGLNFPGNLNEPGFDAPGNVHGKYDELSTAILAALPGGGCVAANAVQ